MISILYLYVMTNSILIYFSPKYARYNELKLAFAFILSRRHSRLLDTPKFFRKVFWDA